MKYAVFFLSIFTFFSCSRVIMVVYGIDSPKPKTEEELHQFLAEKELRLDNNYAVSAEYWQKEMQERVAFPTVLLFDKYKNLLAIENNNPDSECEVDIPNFIKMLHKNSIFKNSSSDRYKDILTNLKSFQGEAATFESLPKGDFYMFVFWASFMGKKNEKLKSYEAAVLLNPDVDLVLTKVSFDPQTWWESQYLEQF